MHKRRSRAAASSQQDGSLRSMVDDGRTFWDMRHSVGENFDWITGYSELRGIFDMCAPDRSCRVLNLGCGTSQLSEDMFDDGYKHIMSIDFSPVAIFKMSTQNKSKRPEMEWQVADATHLAGFPDDSFDVVVDKSTFDYIASMNKQVDVVNLLAEVSRVLRVGGTYFLVTLNKYLLENPESLLSMPHLAFKVETFSIGTSSDCICICCRKLPQAAQLREAYLGAVLQNAQVRDAVADSASANRVTSTPVCASLNVAGLGRVSQVMEAVRTWCGSNSQATSIAVCSSFAAFMSTLPGLLSAGQLRVWQWARAHGPAQTCPQTMPTTAVDLEKYCSMVVDLLWTFDCSSYAFEDRCAGCETLQDHDLAVWFKNKGERTGNANVPCPLA